jgi:hypothetical protein
MVPDMPADTDSESCIKQGFGYTGPFLRNDLGVDSTGSLPPSDYAIQRGRMGAGLYFIPRCTGYIPNSGGSGLAVLCALYESSYTPVALTATNETATTKANTPSTIDLKVGANGNPTSAALVGTPVGGTVSGFPSTTVTFTPTTGFSGPASFQFTLANAGGSSNVATTTVTVLPPPPVAISQALSTRANRPLTINLARPRPNIRVTSRHLDHLSGSRVVISSSKRPYGLTCSHVSGVNALRSVAVNRPCQWGWARTSCSMSVFT